MRKTWVKTDATIEPVTLVEAKSYCKITGTGDDYFITDLLSTCREEVEQFTQMSLAPKTIISEWDKMPNGEFVNLPYGPVESIVSVKTIDEEGVEETLTLNTEYHIIGAPWTQIRVSGVYSTRALRLRVEYNVGYDDEHTPPLPSPLKTTILKRILTHYDHREDIDNEGGSNSLPNSGFELAAPYRKDVWFAEV